MDYFLAHFQEHNDEQERHLVYHLGNRGFYAEITTVMRAMLYAYVNDYRLCLCSEDFGYRYQQGFRDYFLPFCDEYDPAIHKGDVTNCYSDIRGPGTMFDKVRAFMPDEISFGPVTLKGRLEILHFFMNMIFRFSPEVKKRVNDHIGRLKLPVEYNAIHIRRGDKVGDEDVFHPSDLYLEQLPQNTDGNLPIFILSDDFRAIEELRQRLTAQGQSLRTFTMCTKEHAGFDIYALRDRSLVYQKKEGVQKATEKEYKENIFEETVRLLAETVIASRATTFVGTQLSNIGWMVKALHHDKDCCRLIMPKQMMDHSNRVKEPHKYYLDHKKEYMGEAGHETLLTYLKQYLEPVSQKDTFVILADIGTCTGKFLPHLEQLGRDDHDVILGFEPNPLNCEVLESIRLTKPFLLVKCGLSDKAGTQPFFTNREYPHNKPGYTLASLRGDGDEIGEIAVDTFDEVIERLGYRDYIVRYIKIDTEGNDTKVLRGMERTLHKVQYIVFESSDCLDDHRGPGEQTPLWNIIQFLDEHGFDTYKLGQRRFLKLNGSHWHQAFENTKFHSNCFALKKDDPIIEKICDNNGFLKPLNQETVPQMPLPSKPRPKKQIPESVPVIPVSAEYTQCVVSEQFRFIFVPIDKNASSSLKRVLLKDIYQTKLIRKKDIPVNQWREFFVFSFVRDPVDRFLSAYQELSMRNESEKRDHLPFFSMNEGMKRLESFLASAEKCKWDHHILDQKSFLQGVDLDYLGTLNNLDNDLEYVALQLGMPPAGVLPTLRSRQGRKEIYGYGKHIHHQKDLPEDLIKKIQNLYSGDAQLYQNVLSASSKQSISEEVVQPMEIIRRNGESFFLFLDIFIHWSGTKITATAPHYGDDIDWARYEVDLTKVVLTTGNVTVNGNYIPHRLDCWEPAILFDFESPELLELLEKGKPLEIEIAIGPHRQKFTIDCCPPPSHSVAMGVIIRDENQWIKYYIDYYLKCMGVSHIFVYDNHTADKKRLLEILSPYVRLNKVTYIPWHYRWRNHTDHKQIGQPPQQSHTLNRYGTTPWIGMFDVDEFLRIPGKTLPEFLAGYNPEEIDGLSFDIRWFMYKGKSAMNDVGNPLFSFFHKKPDKEGRKRQKLVVSARNVRFLRFHWLEQGKKEEQITDPDIFFHHYYVQRNRFERGKQEPGTVYDDYMLRFVPILEPDKTKPLETRESRKIKILPKTLSNTQHWIDHIDQSFALAEIERSNLTHEILGINGMCGVKNRHFINNICNFEGCEYLEIGTFKGASLCAALHGNAISATAIDNWTGFGGPKDIFHDNLRTYAAGAQLDVIEKDCFSLDVSRMATCNVYYYDGDHTSESQYRAIKHYMSLFRKHTILIVDDWNWKQVREGTRKAIAELDLTVSYEKEIILPEADVAGMPRHKGAETWWNGIYVALVEK